ncbi:MAG: EthD domain-containing protein [Pseudomonadales bacterium]|nr:EthD domain-containing protein [Pseudomonadales bacterium]
MEKIISLLWKETALSSGAFKQAIFDAASVIETRGASRIRFNVVDEAVAAADSLRIINQGNPVDAIFSFWLDSAQNCSDVEELLGRSCSSLCSYLVTESEPLLNVKYPAQKGLRTEGMNQVVFLQKPETLGREEWLKIWLQSHGPLAIEIQSTFGYRQNIVQRRLTQAGPVIDAIVEENFPVGAMTDLAVFYAADDEAMTQRRQQQMIESVMRFIEFDKIDCIPMSEYSL